MIIIGNVGSTSLKTKILDVNDNEIEILGEANFDRIKTPGLSNFTSKIKDSKKNKEQIEMYGFEQGINYIVNWYIDKGVIKNKKDINAVGFKTVLAGEDRGACILTDEVIQEMEALSYVAPVHNIPYVESINIFKKIFSDIPVVGVFETSYHYEIPLHRKLTGLSLDMEEEYGIRQRGYHGASGRYGAELTKKMHFDFLNSNNFNIPNSFKLIYNHLGGSSSTHAVLDGKSIATSMSFSLQAGHYQNTRVGDFDPFALLYIMKKGNHSVDDMQKMLSQDAGLKAMAGINSDEMADIMDAAEKGNKKAQLTVNAFIDRIKQYIGAYAAILNGVDAITFAGGIGEKGIEIREKVCEGLSYLGIEIDKQKNEDAFGINSRITTDDSKVQVYTIQTNEEAVVAYFTNEVLKKGRDLKPEEMKFTL